MTKTKGTSDAPAAAAASVASKSKRIAVNALGFTHNAVQKRVKRSGVSRPHSIIMGASELVGKRLIREIQRRAIAIMCAENRRQLVMRDMIQAAAAINIETVGFAEFGQAADAEQSAAE
jgi:hypothetical protein